MRSIINCFRWWGRHKVVSLLAMLVLMAAIRLVWGWYVSRQLRGALAVRAAGLPASFAEITVPTIPDDQNAWLLQLKAIEAMTNIDCPRGSSFSFPDPPYPANWFKLAAASESGNAQSFILAHRARQYSAVQFRKNGTGAWNASYLNNCKTLANAMADSAEYAHFTHNDALALDRLLDLLHLARSIRQDDFEVSQLVAMGIENLTCNAAQTIGADLGVDPATASSPEVNSRLRQLINELLDERVATAGFRRAMTIEPLIMQEEYRKRAAPTWFIRPLADHQAIRTFRVFDVLVKGAQAENYPQMVEILKDLNPEDEQKQPDLLFGPVKFRSKVPRYSRWFFDDWFYSRAVPQRQFRAFAERRATAVSLACQLYRSEVGKWPEKISQLVPRYMAALPADPFQSDGRPIGYVRVQTAGSDRPVIYFDPGGRDAGVPSTQMTGWNPTYSGAQPRGVRQYRDVTRIVPTTSPKAVNNQPDKTDAPGQDPQKNQQSKQP